MPGAASSPLAAVRVVPSAGALRGSAPGFPGESPPRTGSARTAKPRAPRRSRPRRIQHAGGVVGLLGLVVAAVDDGEQRAGLAPQRLALSRSQRVERRERPLSQLARCGGFPAPPPPRARAGLEVPGDLTLGLGAPPRHDLPGADEHRHHDGRDAPGDQAVAQLRRRIASTAPRSAPPSTASAPPASRAGRAGSRAASRPARRDPWAPGAAAPS